MTARETFKTLALSTTAMSALMLAMPAVAQDASTDAEVTEIEEVIVTGSRIANSNATTPAPINAITAEDMKLSGAADVSESMVKVPALMNSATTEQRTTNVGASFLNLRGLGASRTLTLVNGQRHVGGQAGTTAVDINTIPSALIERVDVMTGGASAIYGADAVTGVVNFIMKKDFEGIQGEARVRSNDKGDATRYQGSLAFGSNFNDDRGNVTLYVSYDKQDMLTCGEQSWCEGNQTYLDYEAPEGVTNDQGAYLLFGPDTRFNISSKDGRIALDPWGGGWGDNAIWTPELADYPLDLNNNGTPDTFETVAGSQWGYGSWLYDGSQLRFFDEGQVNNPANSFGGDGIANFLDRESIIPEYEQIVIGGSSRYALNDNINFFFEGKFVQTKAQTIGGVNSFGDLFQAGLDNPFVPAELKAATDAFLELYPEFADTFMYNITRDQTDIGAPTTDNTRQTWRVVTGFDGEFDNGWSWTASFNYGETSENTLQRNNRIEDRWFAAIDATTDENGNPVCQIDVTPGYTIPGDRYPATFDGTVKTFAPGEGECVPFNLFGAGQSSQAAVDWITTDLLDTGKLTQQVVNLTLVGDSADMFELPGGPVDFAVGGEYRKETSVLEVDNMSQLGLVFDGTKSFGTGGDYSVKEVFGEIKLPIFTGERFAEELSVNAAVRLADYNTIGNATSWMVNASWAPVEDIRFRGTYSIALRSPNISELYQPLTSVTSSPLDPCDANNVGSYSDPSVVAANCAAHGIDSSTFFDPNTGRISGRVGGNQDLLEEKSETYTLGVVMTPSFIEGLSLTVDYWNIKLTNAIDTIAPQDVIDLCYTDPSGVNNPFCDKIGRNANTLGLNYFETGVANVAQQNVRGVDFDLRYGFAMDDLGVADGGAISINVTGTRLLKAFGTPFENDPDTIDPYLLEIRNPKWTVNTDVTWSRDDLTIRYNLYYMSNQAWSPRVDLEDGVDPLEKWINPWAGNTFIHNISASYDLNDEWQIYGGVNNIADKDPFKPRQSYPTNASGRTLFLGVQFKM